MDNGNCVNQDSEKKLLKDIREELGLTQAQLAKTVGIHQERISEIERGKKVPDWLIKAVRLNQILEQAGYSLSDLSLPSPPSEN